jgi:hypothetical protein
MVVRTLVTASVRAVEPLLNANLRSDHQDAFTHCCDGAFIALGQTSAPALPDRIVTLRSPQIIDRKRRSTNPSASSSKAFTA